MTISNINKKEKYRLEEHAHEDMPHDICIDVNPNILQSMQNKKKEKYTLFFEAQASQPNENNTVKRDFKHNILGYETQLIVF